jgi:ATP-binding cassette subfamily B protein
MSEEEIEQKSEERAKNEVSLIKLLISYKWGILLLAIFTIAGNALNLAVPKIIASAIDSYTNGSFVLENVIITFFSIAVGILVFTYLQGIIQTITSERIARNLRTDIIAKISVQDNAYIQKVTPSKLLTNLTSDVNNVKTFIAQSLASFISSLFLIIGASFLLLSINWKLALAVLTILPIIGIAFYVIIGRVRQLFTKAQEAIDWLNKVINESVLGAALIRLLNSHEPEHDKFMEANANSRDVSMGILKMFATLLPIITLTVNLATLTVLTLGGYFVIGGSMTLGEFTAFNSYIAILIFPIIIIGFTSNSIAQASASYQRIGGILNSSYKKYTGKITTPLVGNVEAKNVSIIYGERTVLKDISFEVKANTRTAIIGPTAAGKTQLLYLLTGLIEPTSGLIEYDNKNIDDYEKVKLHQQVGFVFQDSFMFNLTIRENIAFSNTVKDEDIAKAIETAELRDFIDALPEKLDTIVSERGTSLSGGQKQRVMLARALALNPKVLLLDDFTARVDTSTEQKILKNVQKNYPDITLISVTQKIAPIENYDQIILLMEGEILASGPHKELMNSSMEYVQIYDSQKSTNNYESTDN